MNQAGREQKFNPGEKRPPNLPNHNRSEILTRPGGYVSVSAHLLS